MSTCVCRHLSSGLRSGVSVLLIHFVCCCFCSQRPSCLALQISAVFVADVQEFCVCRVKSIVPSPQFFLALLLRLDYGPCGAVSESTCHTLHRGTLLVVDFDVVL